MFAAICQSERHCYILTALICRPVTVRSSLMLRWSINGQMLSDGEMVNQFHALRTYPAAAANALR